MLRILAYHRIGPAPRNGDLRDPVASATPDGFARQMRHLRRRYRVVSLQEVLEAVRSAASLPARAVLITFDDGYRDFAERAWPVLRAHDLPVTLFVPTAFPGTGEEFWWDRLFEALSTTSRPALTVPGLGRLDLGSAERRRAALRRIRAYLKTMPPTASGRLLDRIREELGGSPGRAVSGGAASLAVAPGEGTRAAGRVLSWAELRELAAQGVTVAAHSRTHPPLTRLHDEDVAAEIRGSMEDLRRELGAAPPVFCYPYGDHDPRVVRLARAAGVELGLTCLPGHNPSRPEEPLRLRRTAITLRSTPFVFRQRLRPLVSLLDRWRQERRAGPGSAGHPGPPDRPEPVS